MASVIIVASPNQAKFRWDRSVSIKELRSGRFATRRYRNRRIGEFLKELRTQGTFSHDPATPKFGFDPLHRSGFDRVRDQIVLISETQLHPATSQYHEPFRVDKFEGSVPMRGSPAVSQPRAARPLGAAG